MPAAYTHYQFGRDLYDHLDDDTIKDEIFEGLDCFNIGLHGPDIFFYNKPYLFNKINKYGQNMHKLIAYDFFDKSRLIIKTNDQKAYIYGFLCHYALDSLMHPYVHDIMAQEDLGHFEVESEYDRLLMTRHDYNPIFHALTSHIHVTQRTVCAIQPFFPMSYLDIHQSLVGMKFYDHVLLAPNPLKRGLLYSGFALTTHFHKLQGLVINYQANPKMDKHIHKLDELYHQALINAQVLIKDYRNNMNNDHQLSPLLNHTYSG